ncbi:Trypsin [Halopseudomonas xinjiangensis]|uniref:Trypsin n=2 Tax=Halopseudomonas xinjiangensis TaxID=487184 RepID=A0A1H1X1X6_9GAMM|nr:Trypsin [Halopseudomonas xinjiangensis]
MSQTDALDDLSALLTWSELPTGQFAAAIRIVSPGAKGIRLALRAEKLHPYARFNFVSADGEQVRTVLAMSMIDTLFRTRAATPESPQDALYMGPLTEGDEVTLEILLPVGVSPQAVSFSIPRLSHVEVLPYQEKLLFKQAQSGACNIDVSCRPEWESVAQGVARMLYTDTATAQSYVCTGTLLNNTRSTGTPYFLTANHCLSTESVAATLETYWFYQTDTCGGGISAEAQPRFGSTLLYTDASTDTTLLRLTQQPPAGVIYQGWATGLIGIGETIGGVHHPAGDLQKVSVGQAQGYAYCQTNRCLGADPTIATHIATNWSLGVTEPGSSGSGLFLPYDGRYFLAGQLTGGTSSCDTPSGVDFYGRFDTAYDRALARWLDPDPIDQARSAIYRFYNTQSGTHFMTANTFERDSIIRTAPHFRYEGIAFYAYASGTTGLSPVYRFYNRLADAHFYTISQAERDHVIATQPNFSYEGAAWYAKIATGGESSPLYRFYNLISGTHFYTTSEAEKNHIRSNLPSYRYEGVGYYTWVSN